MLVDWDRNLNWFLHVPPSRPSLAHLAAVRKVVDGIDTQSSRLLIMGSTPEFCDLAAELKFKQVFVVDKSPTFHEHARSVRRLLNESERYVCADWLDYFRANANTFDVILSDLTLGNIEYGRRDEYSALITRCLRPGGVLVDKVLTNETGYRDLDSLDRWFGTPGVSIQSLNRFSCAYYFTSTLAADLLAVDVDTITAELIARYNGTGTTQEALLRRVHLLTPPGSTWHYGRPWLAIEKTYFPKNVVNTLYSEPGYDSPYCDRLRIFEVRR